MSAFQQAVIHTILALGVVLAVATLAAFGKLDVSTAVAVIAAVTGIGATGVAASSTSSTPAPAQPASAAPVAAVRTPASTA